MVERLDREHRADPAVRLRRAGGSQRTGGHTAEAGLGTRREPANGLALVQAGKEVGLVVAPVGGEVEVSRELELVVAGGEIQDLVDPVCPWPWPGDDIPTAGFEHETVRLDPPAALRRF